MKKFGLFIFLLAVIFGCTKSVFATAWESALIGERSAAMGNAYTGISDTPEAFHFNPAGLAQISNFFAISIGANFPVTLEYTYQDLSGITHRSKDIPVPPHIYLVFKFWKIALGVGYWVPIGGGQLKFDNINAYGFYDVNEQDQYSHSLSMIFTHDIAPTISAEILDWFYVGASFVFHVGQLIIDLENYPKQSELGATMVNNKYEGVGVWYGANFGLLIKDPFLKIFSLGFAYRMQYTMKTQGDTNFDITSDTRELAIMAGMDLPATFDTRSELIIPHMFMVGLSANIFDIVIIAFDFQYSMWGSCKQLDLYWDTEIPEALTLLSGLTNHQIIKTGYKDAYYIKFGVEFEPLLNLFLRAGFLYAKESKIGRANSLVSIDPRGYVITYGIGYNWSIMEEELILGFDLTFYHALGREVEITEAELDADLTGPAGRYNRNLYFGFMGGISLYLF